MGSTVSTGGKAGLQETRGAREKRIQAGKGSGGGKTWPGTTSADTWVCLPALRG